MATRKMHELEPPVMQTPTYSPEWMQPRRSMVDRLFPFIFVLMLVMSFALGSLWTKVEYLKNPPTTTGTTTGTNQAQQAQAPAQVQVSADTIKGLFDKDLIKFGDAKKKVLFVEVADPSCPYCHIAAGKNSELNAQSGQFKLVADGGTYVAPVEEMRKMVEQGQAGFVWIYSNGHGNGEVATKALYCAYEQGKFWQAHDKLMNNEGYNLINNQVMNDKTKHKDVVAFLGNAVDGNRLQSCLDSGKYDGRISSDQSVSSSLGVNGTPGFFVNTTNFAGAYSWNDMKSAVDAAIN